MITILMLVLGLLSHFLKDLIRIKAETGQHISPIEYWTKYPYKTLFCIIGAIIGYVFLMESNQLTAFAAFGMGYISNSVADMLGKRSADTMK